MAASALAHAALFTAAFLQRPTLALPDEAEAFSPDVIHVELAPRPAAGRPQPPRLHRTPKAPAGAPRALIAPSAPSLADTRAPGPLPAPPGPDLRPGLRHGLAGCADLAAVGLSRAERDLCDERLGRAIDKEPFRPAAIEGRIRAYYDQVALAKAREPQPVPVVNKAPIPGEGLRMPAGRDHVPAIGCSLPFGVGKKPKSMPHALRFGPCFIEPPKGPLDPEVDIVPP